MRNVNLLVNHKYSIRDVSGALPESLEKLRLWWLRYFATLRSVIVRSISAVESIYINVRKKRGQVYVCNFKMFIYVIVNPKKFALFVKNERQLCVGYCYLPLK